MQTRLLRYLVALAREQHFARAAAACNVSQPTLSAGLAALEEQLGKRLVLRDRRFLGLTAEGAAVLPWAQQMLAISDSMVQAVALPGGVLRGEIRLGVIPAAVPVAGYVSAAVRRHNPEVQISIRSLTSREIQNGLDAFELDGGLTYLDHEPPVNAMHVPLYAEQYVFACHAAQSVPPGRTIELSEASQMPLCLLHQGMQNRRILDARLAERGLVLHPRVTADTYLALMALVETGEFATIVPDSYSGLIGRQSWARLIAFSDPLPPSRIGLVVLDRSPLGSLSLALLSAARGVALPKRFHRFDR